MNVRVPQPGKQLPHRVRQVAHRSRDFAMVGLGRIQQQDGVSGGRGIENHEAVLPFGHGSRERTEHRDFLGTGGSQVLLEQGHPLRVELGRRFRQDGFRILAVSAAGSIRLTDRFGTDPPTVAAT